VSEFIHPALKELADQQVRFAPVARRTEQLAKAEKLLSEIVPDRVYPYQFVCFRVTDFRSAAHPDLLFPGRDLQHDLAALIRRLERSLPPLPVELAAEPMLSLEEVGERFHVSTKTVTRWRLLGLQCRRVLRDGKRQLGFPLSSVEEFARTHRDQVARGGRFSHLTDDEKDRIVLDARRMAAGGETLTGVSRRIAEQLGRSAEAVRYTIKNFDRAHPDAAVFPDTSGPLDAAAKRMIFDAFQEGKPVDLIAKRFKRTRSSMYRVINEVRAEQLLRQPVDYIYNADFDDPAKHADMAGPMPDEAEFNEKMKASRAPSDVEAHMRYLYSKPLLNFKQEQHLFRKMNFLKHQLKQMQGRIDPAKARVSELAEVEKLGQQITAARDVLIECNLRLVHKLASQHMQASQGLDELKSDAHISLMRAVEKFDYGRGFKFSTYATWAIVKNFARSIPDEFSHRTRYVTGHEEMLEHRMDTHSDEGELMMAAEQAKQRVNRLLEHLDPRTREVIRMRTGIDGSEEMTLEQIGQHFGITKERVRQINVRGMKQLREKAAEENVDLP
jgi:RNA polymerase sigma factor (sigma-70 family)